MVIADHLDVRVLGRCRANPQSRATDVPQPRMHWHDCFPRHTCAAVTRSLKSMVCRSGGHSLPAALLREERSPALTLARWGGAAVT